MDAHSPIRGKIRLLPQVQIRTAVEGIRLFG